MTVFNVSQRHILQFQNFLAFLLPFQLNQKEFEDMEDDVRVQYEGYRPGMYVRIEIKSMPCEFIENFDPSYPVVLGGLLAGEDDIGFIQVRDFTAKYWVP